LIQIKEVGHNFIEMMMIGGFVCWCALTSVYLLILIWLYFEVDNQIFAVAYIKQGFPTDC